MGKHSDDSGSFYRWGRRLGGVPAAVDAFAKQIDELARQAREDQPAASPLADEIQATAALLRKVGSRSQGWYAAFRRLHPRDNKRVEDPRKNARVEAKADAGAYLRDCGN